MIKLNNVQKKFKDNLVLNSINYDFDQVGCYIVIGINGSGKTTLFDLIAGVSKVSKGEVACSFSSKDLFYITSDFFLPEYLTGNELKQFYARHYGNLDFEKCAKLEKHFKIDGDMNKQICDFSYGMKKKLQFVFGMALSTKVLIMDEITTGLDIVSKYQVTELINNNCKDRLIIYSTHDIDYLQNDDQVLLLDNGNLHVQHNFDKAQFLESVKRYANI